MEEVHEILNLAYKNTQVDNVVRLLISFYLFFSVAKIRVSPSPTRFHATLLLILLKVMFAPVEIYKRETSKRYH